MFVCVFFIRCCCFKERHTYIILSRQWVTFGSQWHFMQRSLPFVYLSLGMRFPSKQHNELFSFHIHSRLLTPHFNVRSTTADWISMHKWNGSWCRGSTHNKVEKKKRNHQWFPTYDDNSIPEWVRRQKGPLLKSPQSNVWLSIAIVWIDESKERVRNMFFLVIASADFVNREYGIEHGARNIPLKIKKWILRVIS